MTIKNVIIIKAGGALEGHLINRGCPPPFRGQLHPYTNKNTGKDDPYFSYKGQFARREIPGLIHLSTIRGFGGDVMEETS